MLMLLRAVGAAATLRGARGWPIIANGTWRCVDAADDEAVDEDE
jgi:hypothetical protein